VSARWYEKQSRSGVLRAADAPIVAKVFAEAISSPSIDSGTSDLQLVTWSKAIAFLRASDVTSVAPVGESLKSACRSVVENLPLSESEFKALLSSGVDLNDPRLASGLRRLPQWRALSREAIEVLLDRLSLEVQHFRHFGDIVFPPEVPSRRQSEELFIIRAFQRREWSAIQKVVKFTPRTMALKLVTEALLGSTDALSNTLAELDPPYTVAVEQALESLTFLVSTGKLLPIVLHLFLQTVSRSLKKFKIEDELLRWGKLFPQASQLPTEPLIVNAESTLHSSWLNNATTTDDRIAVAVATLLRSTKEEHWTNGLSYVSRFLASRNSLPQTESPFSWLEPQWLKALSTAVLIKCIPRYVIQTVVVESLQQNEWLDALKVLQSLPAAASSGDMKDFGRLIRSEKILDELVLAQPRGWEVAIRLLSYGIKDKFFIRGIATSLLLRHGLWAASLQTCLHEVIGSLTIELLPKIPSSGRWLAAFGVLQRIEKESRGTGREEPLTVRQLLALLNAIGTTPASNTSVDVVVGLGQESTKQSVRLVLDSARLPSQYRMEHIPVTRWVAASKVLMKLPAGLLKREDISSAVDNLVRETAAVDWVSSASLFSIMRSKSISPSSHTLSALQGALLANNQTEGAESLTDRTRWNVADVSPSRELQILRSHVQQQEWISALRFVRSSGNTDVSRSDEWTGLLVQLLKQCNYSASWKAVALVLSEWINKASLNKRLASDVYMAAVNSFSRAGRWEETIRAAELATSYTSSSRLATTIAIMVAKSCRKAEPCRWLEALANYDLTRRVVGSSARERSEDSSDGSVFLLLMETISACMASGFALNQVQMWIRVNLENKALPNSTKEKDAPETAQEFVFTSTPLPQSFEGDALTKCTDDPAVTRLLLALLSAQGRNSPDDATAWSSALSVTKQMLFRGQQYVNQVGASALSGVIELCIHQHHWREAFAVLGLQRWGSQKISRHAIHQLLSVLEQRLEENESPETSRRLLVEAQSLYQSAQKNGTLDRLIHHKYAGCILSGSGWMAALGFAQSIVVPMHPHEYWDHLYRKIIGTSSAPPILRFQIAALQGSTARLQQQVPLIQDLLRAQLWQEACQLLSARQEEIRHSTIGSTLWLEGYIAQRRRLKDYSTAVAAFHTLTQKTRASTNAIIDAALSLAALHPNGEKVSFVAQLLTGAAFQDPQLLRDRLANDPDGFPMAYQQAVQNVVEDYC
jgi:hypothetical protein